MSDESENGAETERETSHEMTETTDTRTGGTNSEESNTLSEEEQTNENSDLRRKANYALLAGLSLLALIAALQFYLNASSVINQWVTHEYRSLFQAAFNLVVLLVAAAGISRQVRRLTD
ncbi:hypothetical protein [Halolamina sp.]|uniref:hypothetical protein n=1 Tax=Halolamina sp. TaxID=1940283 RepID=UPI003564AB87